MGAGVLSNVISLNTPDFTIKLDLTLDDHTVIGDMIDWSFDIFNGQSGSLEGFCVQVANDAYTDALRKKKTQNLRFTARTMGMVHGHRINICQIQCLLQNVFL